MSSKKSAQEDVVVFSNQTKYLFAKTFCPSLQLTAHERYPFMDADEFLSWCTPEAAGGDGGSTESALKLKLAYQKYLPGILNKYDPSPFPATQPGRFYANFQYEEAEFIRLTYGVFYPYNGFQVVEIDSNDGSSDSSFKFELAPMASHQGDWENIIVFVKIKDASLKLKQSYVEDPSNWELYCVYGSGHGKCDFGLAKKYYDDETFRSKFQTEAENATKIGSDSKEIIQRTQIVDASDLGNIHVIEPWPPRPVNMAQTVDSNGINPIVYASLNGHANHFDQDISRYSDFILDLGNGLTFGTDAMKALRKIKAGDYTFYGDAENGYYAFGDDTGSAAAVSAVNQDVDDEKKAAVAAAELQVMDGNSMSLLFEDAGDGNAWKRIDTEGGEESLCEWANAYAEYTWGQTKETEYAQLVMMVPPTMNAAADSDPDGVVALVRNAIALFKVSAFFGVNIKNGGRAPYGPTRVNAQDKRWWKDFPLIKVEI